MRREEKTRGGGGGGERKKDERLKGKRKTKTDKDGESVKGSGW